MPEAFPIDHIRIVCPECGHTGGAPRSAIGQEAKCPKCDWPFTIAASVVEKAAPTTEKPLAAVDCRLCQTRMYFPIEHVGRKAKCPDCHVLTVIPPPKAPAAKKIPAAMEGEQYELDDTPPPVSTIRMEDWLVEDEPDRPNADRRANKRPTEKDADEHAAPSDRATPSNSTRPALGSKPLVKGVLAFRKSPGLVARWLVLSFWLAIGLALLGVAMAGFSSIGGVGMGSFGGGLLGVACLAGSSCILLLWFGAFAAHAIAITTESSDGAKLVQGWPTTNPTDWFGEGFLVFTAVLTSGAPGWVIARLAGQPDEVCLAASAASFWVAFPVVLLSQLETSSIWGVFSPGIAASVFAALGSWLLFWFESLLLFAAAVGAAIAAAYFPAALFVAGPIWVALALVYFRLVGRLAWVLTEVTSVELE